MLRGFLDSAFLSTGFLTEGEAPPVFNDGSGLIITGRKRRPRPRALDRLPEDIIREQRESERYVAELETKKQVAPAVVPKADEPEVAVPVVAQLPDALARAVSAQQVIERARASSAEVIARAKAEEKRRKVLLLLALD